MKLKQEIGARMPFFGKNRCGESIRASSENYREVVRLNVGSDITLKFATKIGGVSHDFAMRNAPVRSRFYRKKNKRNGTAA